MGNQNYLIPKDVNLEEYNTVVIWCRAFSATFRTGELTESSE
ncbi:DM13 domain-containing protein [Exiguobacterium sp. MER 193]|nr:DM13 domain-containing protein [Exiguobacterium sp. MER 193]